MEQLHPLAPWIVLGGLVLLLGVWLTLRVSRWWRSRVGRRAQRRGVEAERRALRLLRRRGFRALKVQPRARMMLLVDGEPTRFSVQADALVEGPRGGRWVVEVKTGAKASICHRNTRRQVLEYVSCFAADGVLLVDPDHASVVTVQSVIDERSVRHP